MWILVYTLLVVVLDQITKRAAYARLPRDKSLEILGDFFQFTYVENKGMAFGITLGSGDGGRIFFTIFAALASVVILIYLYRMRHEGFYPRFSLALILGGAIGNLIDRFAYGKVIDFIDVGFDSTRWPVFNIADSAVTVGMIILITLVLFERDKTKTAPASPPFPAQQPAPSDEQDNWRDVQHRN